MTELVIGIFVGGAGSRMGGVAKGLLAAPSGGETLVTRLVRICKQAAPAAELCLVGQRAAYAELGLLVLADEPSGVGPIGGLRALLRHAERQQAPKTLALACDLPFLDESVLSRLLVPSQHAARVPRFEGHLQPLTALYVTEPSLRAVDAALADGQHALRDVLQRLGDTLEVLDFLGVAGRALEDWDQPEDMQRGH